MNVFDKIAQYIRRRPLTQMSILKLIGVATAAVAARTIADVDWSIVIIAFLGVIGVDLTATKIGESQTTPLKDPKLGANRPMPPALRDAAQKLFDLGLIATPIQELFVKLGVDAMWTLVNTIQASVSVPLTPEMLEEKRDEIKRTGQMP